MPDANDMDLVRDFTRQNSEAAFAELVRRHINLVYSVALRYTGHPEDAQDVTQMVFLILAQKAAGLRERTVLTGWLYETTRFTAAKVLRTKARRAAHELEACMQTTLNESDSGDVWRQLAPHLEEAMGRLGEHDRTLLALRFYENKSGAEAAALLGIREVTAHKRTARAVEKLRKFFATQGVTVSASGLVVVITANAVQAAPAGLALTIATAATLAGTTLAATTNATAIKAIAMTMLQKTIIGATLAAAVGTGIYEARQVSHLRAQNQTLQQQQAPLADQIERLQHERADATIRLTLLAEAVSKVKGNSAELLKLRGEVARLRMDARELNDPVVQNALAWKEKKEKLQRMFEQAPDKRIPEMQMLTDQQWLDVAKDKNLDSEEGIRQAMSETRQEAKNTFAPLLATALQKFMMANSSQLPKGLEELKPYWKGPVDDALLGRYKLAAGGSPDRLTAVVENSVVDDDYDRTVEIGPHHWGAAPESIETMKARMKQLAPALQLFADANNGQRPPNLSLLKPYISTHEQEVAYYFLLKSKVTFDTLPIK